MKLINYLKQYFENPRMVCIGILYHLRHFFSDKNYVKIQYYILRRQHLNLQHPISFSEKLQWLKLYVHNPQYTKMVDKEAAKEYVADIIGPEHIIPTIGVWNSPEEIDWNKLPSKFVLKTTGGGGSDGVIICKNKSELDITQATRSLSMQQKRNIYDLLKEWPYKNVPPRIIAEKFMEQPGERGLIDYKFYCFDGEPKFLYISKDLDIHEMGRISFITMDWTFAPFNRSDYKCFDELPQKPALFEQMKEIASRLSKGIPFLRVDLYEICNQVFFSELTFYPGGGYTRITPEEWDIKLGDFIKLPEL